MNLRFGTTFIPQIAPLLGGDPFLDFEQLQQQQQQPWSSQLPFQSLIQHVAPLAPPGLQQMIPTTIPTPTQQYGQLPFSTVLQQLAPFAPPGLQQATGQPTAPPHTQSMPGHNPGHNPGHHYGNPGYHYGSIHYCGC